MSHDLHDIDQLFKNALNGHEERVSPRLWEALDRRLDKHAVKTMRGRYNRLRWAAVVLLIFSCSLVAYFISGRQAGNKLAKSPEKKISPFEGLTGYDQMPLTKPGIPVTRKPGFGEVSPRQSAKGKRVDGNVDEVSKSKLTVQFKVNDQLNIDTTITSTSRFAAVKSTRFLTTNRSEAFVTLPDDEQQEVHMLYAQTERAYTLSAGSLPIMVSNAAITPLAMSPGFIPEKKSRLRANTKRFTLTAFLSPEFVFRSVRQNLRLYREDDRNEIREKEAPGVSKSFGLLTHYRFKSGFGVGTGVTYFKTVNNIARKNVYARPDNSGNLRYRLNSTEGYAFLSPSTGVNPMMGDSLPTLGTQNVLHYVAVPFDVNYSFRFGKLRVIPSVGVSANILLKPTVKTEIVVAPHNDKLTLNAIEGLKRIFISSNIAVAAEYKINSLLAVTLAPTGRFALEPLNSDGPVKTFQNAFGIATGMSIQL